METGTPRGGIFGGGPWGASAAQKGADGNAAPAGQDPDLGRGNEDRSARTRSPRKGHRGKSDGARRELDSHARRPRGDENPLRTRGSGGGPLDKGLRTTPGRSALLIRSAAESIRERRGDEPHGDEALPGRGQESRTRDSLRSPWPQRNQKAGEREPGLPATNNPRDYNSQETPRPQPRPRGSRTLGARAVPAGICSPSRGNPTPTRRPAPPPPQAHLLPCLQSSCGCYSWESWARCSNRRRGSCPRLPPSSPICAACS